MPFKKFIGAILGLLNRKGDSKVRPVPVLEDFSEDSAVEEELVEFSDSPGTLDDLATEESTLEDSPQDSEEIAESEPDSEALEDAKPSEQTVEELGEPEERGLEDFVQELGLELPDLKDSINNLVEKAEDELDEIETQTNIRDQIQSLDDNLKDVRALAMMDTPNEPQILDTIGGGDPNEARLGLAALQGVRDADSWKIEDETKGIEVQVITDISYDTSSHNLLYRVRQLKFDPNGFLVEITTESATVAITAAEACP